MPMTTLIFVSRPETQIIPVACQKQDKNRDFNIRNVSFVFVLIQFNVPFKIISLIGSSQSIGGAKREYPGKTP